MVPVAVQLAFVQAYMARVITGYVITSDSTTMYSLIKTSSFNDMF